MGGGEKGERVNGPWIKWDISPQKLPRSQVDSFGFQGAPPEVPSCTGLGGMVAPGAGQSHGEGTGTEPSAATHWPAGLPAVLYFMINIYYFF